MSFNILCKNITLIYSQFVVYGGFWCAIGVVYLVMFLVGACRRSGLRGDSILVVGMRRRVSEEDGERRDVPVGATERQ